MSSGVFLKAAVLAKSARRSHGSMIFDVSAFLLFIICSWFSCYFRLEWLLNFRIDFGMHVGPVLDNVLKLLGVRRSPKYHYKRIEKRIEKKSLRECTSFCWEVRARVQEGDKGGGKPPLGGWRFGESEEKKKRGRIYTLDQKGRRILVSLWHVFE